MWVVLAAMLADAAPAGFDIARLPPPEQACRAATTDAIIVCARPREERLVVLPDAVEPAFPKAELGLGGGATAGVRLEQRMLGAAASDRLMIGVKLPF